MLQAPSYDALRAHVLGLGHRFFEGPWNPNLIGIRSKERRAGLWDDLLLLAYTDDDGAQVVSAHEGTTDPSDVWLQSEKRHRDGTLIVVPGQYRGCWGVGPQYLHRNTYPCFKQVAPIAFVRDDNADDILDIEALIARGMEQRDVVGINGHRGSAHRAVPSVGLYSAGCQVWRHPSEFLQVLDFVQWTATRYGNRATYTLLDEWL